MAAIALRLTYFKDLAMYQNNYVEGIKQMSIKEILQNRLPSTRRFVDRRLNEMEDRLQKILEEQQNIFRMQEQLLLKTEQSIIKEDQLCLDYEEIKKKQTDISSQIGKLEAKTQKIVEEGTVCNTKDVEQSKKDILINLDKGITKINQEVRELLLNEFSDTKSRIERSERAAREAAFAEVFHDTIINSTWLMNKRFSPGRWAVGYPGLYALYRILDEIGPRSILEMGLGQSTELITQYAKANPAIRHYVTEHDENWIRFFRDNHFFADNSEILKQEIVHTSYKEDKEVVAYKDLKESIRDKKFDLIFVDAPMGGLAKIYSRIDILEVVPMCLEDSFVIVIDDYNRMGEKRMTAELEGILTDAGIKYHKGSLSGARDTLIIATEDYKWLCTL